MERIETEDGGSKPAYLKDFDPSARSEEECRQAFERSLGPRESVKEFRCRIIAKALNQCIDHYGFNDFHCMPHHKVWRLEECTPDPDVLLRIRKI